MNENGMAPERPPSSRGDRSLKFFKESPIGLASFTREQVAQIEAVVMKHLQQDLGFSEYKAREIRRKLMPRIRPMPLEENQANSAFFDFAGKKSSPWRIYLGDVMGPRGGSIVHEVDHALTVARDPKGHVYVTPEESWIPTAWQLLIDYERLIILETLVNRFRREELSDPDWTARSSKDTLTCSTTRKKQRRAQSCSKTLMHEYCRFYVMGRQVGQKEAAMINGDETKTTSLQEALGFASLFAWDKYENYKIGFFVAGYVRGARDKSAASRRLAQLREITRGKVLEY